MINRLLAHYFIRGDFLMRRIVHTSVVMLLLSTLAFALAGAQEAEWKVGLARIKITPQEPVFMAGYASRNKPYEQIHDDLNAKALVLEDKGGMRGVLVTSDLIGLTAEIATPVRERIAEKIGIPASSVIINSSHTHTGPTLSLDPTPREGRGAADAERTVAYTKDLCEKIVQIAVEASGKLQPAKLSFGTGVVHFVMNRREFTTDRGVILGVNPHGLADRGVPVLRIDGSDGKLLAVICGAASHNTTLGAQDYEISGDYAGHAQRLIEEQHPDAQAMFVLGCAGDANPYPRGTHEISLTHGKELAREVERVLTTKLTPVRGNLRIAMGEAALPLTAPPTREELEKLATARGGAMPWVAQQMLARLNRGEKLPTIYSCPLAVWQFGDDLTLVALSGEVVSEYVRLLEDALGPTRLWIAAYSNDVYGYLPSARVLREGGYETRGLYSGGVGLFAPDAQDVVVGKVRELATSAGRKLP
jgi:neutral ceramidase